MKRTIILTVLICMLLAVLTGCACSHEWTEADCLNGAVCTKCQEVGEAALGHDWMDATCTTPETCRRCGEIQGEILEHNYGDWVIGDTEMTRNCIACGKEESAEIDRELALKQMLPGNWDFWSSWSGMAVGPYDLFWNSIPCALWVGEDGSLWFLNGQQIYEGIWKYDSYQELDNGGAYLFHVEVDGQIAGSMHLMDIKREDLQPQVMYATGGESYMVLRRNDQLETLLESKTLAVSDNGAVNQVHFGPNRVATGNIGGEFTGTWHLKPVGQRYSGFIWEVSVRFLRGGEPQVICFQIFLSRDGIPTEEELKHASIRALGNGDGWEYYRFVDTDTAERMEAVAADGEDQLLGTWTSERLHVYDKDTTEEKDMETQEYSLTFREDGTVTALFDQEYTGTWKYQKVEIKPDYVAYYDYPSYYYQVQLEGMTQPMTVQTISFARLHVSVSDDLHSITGWFNQTDDAVTDHAAQSSDLIVGQWDAVERIENTDQGTVVQVPEPGRYTLTVNADGTFTMNMNGEVTGQWYFSEHTFHSGYCYSFQADGLDCGMVYSIHTPGQLRAFYDIDGVHYGFTMKKQ